MVRYPANVRFLAATPHTEGKVRQMSKVRFLVSRPVKGKTA